MDSLRVVNVTVLEISKTTLRSFVFILLLAVQDIENPARVEASLTRPSHEAFFMACFLGKRSLTTPALDSVSCVWGANGIEATASRPEQQRCTNGYQMIPVPARFEIKPCPVPSKPPNQASQWSLPLTSSNSYFFCTGARVALSYILLCRGERRSPHAQVRELQDVHNVRVQRVEYGIEAECGVCTWAPDTKPRTLAMMLKVFWRCCCFQ